MKNCLYCNCECTITSPASDWYDCEPCGVRFANDNSNDISKFFKVPFETHIKFERDIGDWAYALNLFPDSNRTILFPYNTASGDYPNEIVINHCMNEITPQNCIDKIKTIILFS